MLTFSSAIPYRTARLWFAGLFGLIILVTILSYVQQYFRPQNIAALAPDYKLKCASYAPYHRPGQSPFIESFVASRSQIDEDLRFLSSKFACVRTYSVNQGLDQVPELARKYGMKMYLGIWIGREAKKNQKEIERGIELAKANADVVQGVIVGNEVLLRREQTEAGLAAYIDQVKKQIDIPVTYADVWEFWLKHPALASSVDFVTVHILPFWEDDPQPIEASIEHVSKVIGKVKHTFDKPILIGETGWPSSGRQRETAVPSLVNEARYIREFVHLAETQNLDYNIIEAIDQPWKRRSEGTVGGYWGIFDAHLKPKFSLSEPAINNGHNVMHFVGGLAGALVMLILGMSWHKVSGGIKPSRELLLMANGASFGTLAWMQWQHALLAYRNLEEWLILGGMSLISLLLGIGATLSAASLNDQLRPFLSYLVWLRRTILFGAAVAGILFVCDPRYRDFPSLLYLPAAIGLLSCVIAGNRLQRFNQHEKILGYLMFVSLFGIAYREGLRNEEAIAWLGVTTMLLASFMQSRR